MNKAISKSLTEVSERLPLIFEWEPGVYLFTGKELNLTPLGEKQKFIDNGIYKIELPQMRAVEHRQQVKDAFKKAGLAGVKDYCNNVMAKVE